MPEKKDPKLHEVHTELRRQDHAQEPEQVATGLKPRTPLDAIPEMDDDKLDDLFNDMPV